MRAWIDHGTAEGSLAKAKQMRDVWTGAGYKLGETIGYHEAVGAKHTESAWKARVHLGLRFLFDPGDRQPAFP